MSASARASVLAAVLCAAVGGTAFANGAAKDNPIALWQQSLAAQRFQDMQVDATLTTMLPTGDEVTLRFKMLAVLQPDGINRMLLARVSDGGALKDTCSHTAVDRCAGASTRPRFTLRLAERGPRSLPGAGREALDATWLLPQSVAVGQLAGAGAPVDTNVPRRTSPFSTAQ